MSKERRRSRSTGTHVALQGERFRSHNSYRAFARSITRTRRYVHDEDTLAFPDALRAQARRRVETIRANAALWRAQLGYSLQPWHEGDEYIDDLPAPHPPLRMSPLTDRAREGRANPKGIPYLYLATNRDTALAEVRPWIGSHVSVAQFRILRPLRLVNCTTDKRIGHPIGGRRKLSAKRVAAIVWSDIDKALAEPVTPSDDDAWYAPTQVIAELFRAEGYDGIAYRSALGPGHNVALFDLRAAELANCHLFVVRDIHFTFDQAANPYYAPSKRQKEIEQPT